RRIDDTHLDLDPSYESDGKILQAGIRSMLWQPFGAGLHLQGGVGVSAFHPQAFTDEHGQVLKPIAALLGSAVEHWRLWDAERRRRERLDRLESLVGTLAESLDVRQVFPRIS